MADDLGYGELSCYGSKTVSTPNIDKIAMEGVKFTDYHSNGPVCSPTRAALLTGLYPHQAGIGHILTDEMRRRNTQVCTVFGGYVSVPAAMAAVSARGFAFHSETTPASGSES